MNKKLSIHYLGEEVFNLLDSREWLYNEYVIKERTITSIASELNVSISTVSDRLRKHDIENRGNKGYKRTIEQREKISIKTKEAMKRPDVREKHLEAMLNIDKSGENNAFYGKKHSKETREVMSEKKKELFSDKNNHPMYGRNHTNESIEKMKLQNGENHPSWGGGCHMYWHNKAYDSFGKNECEICGISNGECLEKYNKRLSMHNTLYPKDYTIMEQEAWQCLCSKCHGEVEKK